MIALSCSESGLCEFTATSTRRRKPKKGSEIDFSSPFIAGSPKCPHCMELKERLSGKVPFIDVTNPDTRKRVEEKVGKLTVVPAFIMPDRRQCFLTDDEGGLTFGCNDGSKVEM